MKERIYSNDEKIDKKELTKSLLVRNDQERKTLSEWEKQKKEENTPTDLALNYQSLFLFHPIV